MAILLSLTFSLPSISLAIKAFKRPAGTAMAVWKAWRRQAANRELLRRIDAHLCKDIGVSAARLSAELSRPWWRDPQFHADLKN